MKIIIIIIIIIIKNKKVLLQSFTTKIAIAIYFSEKSSEKSSVFNEKDDEFLNILEKYSNCCSVCKRFKPTLPKPAVGNLFDPDKIKFNQVVSIDLKQYRTNGLFI